MTTSITGRTIEGSSTDYGESLVRSNLIDASRKPYLMARLAVAEYAHPRFSKNARKALLDVHFANDDGVLQPPLSVALANEVEAFLEQHPDERRGVGDANYGALVLLNMIIDNGSRPK